MACSKLSGARGSRDEQRRACRSYWRLRVSNTSSVCHRMPGGYLLKIMHALRKVRFEETRAASSFQGWHAKAGAR